MVDFQNGWFKWKNPNLKRILWGSISGPPHIFFPFLSHFPGSQTRTSTSSMPSAFWRRPPSFRTPWSSRQRLRAKRRLWTRMAQSVTWAIFEVDRYFFQGFSGSFIGQNAAYPTKNVSFQFSLGDHSKENSKTNKTHPYFLRETDSFWVVSCQFSLVNPQFSNDSLQFCHAFPPIPCSTEVMVL